MFDDVFTWLGMSLCVHAEEGVLGDRLSTSHGVEKGAPSRCRGVVAEALAVALLSKMLHAIAFLEHGINEVFQPPLLMSS